MKRFDVDLGKSRLRARWREFIRTRVYDRKNQYVLCFPGEHGFEIEQVYRKLGFRDCNIFGVERDPKAAKAIRERYPDIYVYEGELIDFCREYDGPPFAVVSFDYCGHLATDKLTPLSLLTLSRHMTDRSVFLLNVLAGRESAEIQQDMRGYFAATLQRSAHLEGHALEDVTEHFQEIFNTAKTTPLAEVRSDTLTAGVIQLVSITVPAFEAVSSLELTHLRGSRLMLNHDTTFEREEDKLVINNANLGKSSPVLDAGQIKHEAIQQVNEALKEAGCFDPKLYQDAAVWEILRYHLGRTMVMTFFDQLSYPYLPYDIERYSYISNTGKRMVSDLFEFRTFREELCAMPLVIAPLFHKERPTEHRFFLHPAPADFPSVAAYVDHVMTKVGKPYAKLCARIKSEPGHWPERVDLGGERQVFDEEKAKARAIQLLKKGRDMFEVATKTHLSLGTLRALKAHLTMGTYK